MQRLDVLIIGLLLTCLAPQPSSLAQGPSPELLVNAAGVTELSLEQAFEIALSNSLRLRIERLLDRETSLGIIEQQGIFDVMLNSDVRTIDSTQPPTSTLENTGGAALTSESTSASLGAALLLHSGADLRFDLNDGRFETNNLAVSLIPRYDAGASLSLTQPLLRGLGRPTTARRLLIARTDSAISRQQLQLRVEEVLQRVANAYWDLVAAREQLGVAKESLDLAGELHRSNTIQVRVGTMAQIELVQSQAGVAQREEDTIRFAALVDDQQDVLRELLSFEPGPLWDAELLPISEPEASFVEIDTSSAIERALKLRPEVLSQQLTLENRQLDQRVERRQRWPQLDLDASYQFSGISGTPNDPSLVLEQEGNAGAIQQVLDGLAVMFRGSAQ